MELLLLTRQGFNNPKVWSGTPLALLNAFKKDKRVKITSEDMELPAGLRGIYYRILCSMFFMMYHCHDMLLRPIFYAILWRIYKNNKSKDFSLQINDFYIPDFLRKKGRNAIYVDAHRPEWWKYLLPNDKRLFRGVYMEDFNRATKKSLENADLIFTMNEWTKKGFVKDFSIQESKIVNVHFGVNLQPYYGVKDYSRKLMLIVLREGTEEYKGLNLLLKAMPFIKGKIPDAELAVVGSKVGEGVDGVKCYYNQSREVTVRLFKESTLYTMPALAEPNGITYLEALANKTPIVGLDRFALPEFSGYGEWGFICKKESPEELANVIIDAFSDEERLMEMGQLGQKFVVENFDWGKVEENMVRCMSNLITNNKLK